MAFPGHDELERGQDSNLMNRDIQSVYRENPQSQTPRRNMPFLAHATILPGCTFFWGWSFEELYVRLFPLSNVFFTPLFSLPPSRTSDPGRIVGSSTPSPLRTVRALHFIREKGSALSSLVDSHRIVPTHAITGALDSR